MCYMAVYPPGVLPDPRHLHNGAKLNPHSYGWCVGTDQVQHSMGTLALNPPSVTPDTSPNLSGETLNPAGIVRLPPWLPKTLDAARMAVGNFVTARAVRMSEPAVFHARYASPGSPVTLPNCQPVLLGDGTLVAHNGALFPVDGDESDTRVFAEKFLPQWDLDSPADRADLRDLLGPNKIVILRPGKTPLLLGDRKGVWRPDGSWHSNFDFAGVSHLRAGQCGACGTRVENGPRAGLCPDCQTAWLGRYAALEAAR